MFGVDADTVWARVVRPQRTRVKYFIADRVTGDIALLGCRGQPGAGGPRLDGSAGSEIRQAMRSGGLRHTAGVTAGIVRCRLDGRGRGSGASGSSSPGSSGTGASGSMFGSGSGS